ncbi:Hypothetical_protein [Hexamita inflata]|uniref:Hypothetical_protein n=1 Tax=Hexamita inflata TaxID=28002 RepID=A0AA86NNM9_9EUKA|nr:Hypothetical protein HINF_LOCUS9938 [Hexamita inflata]
MFQITSREFSYIIICEQIIINKFTRFFVAQCSSLLQIFNFEAIIPKSQFQTVFKTIRFLMLLSLNHSLIYDLYLFCYNSESPVPLFRQLQQRVNLFEIQIKSSVGSVSIQIYGQPLMLIQRLTRKQINPLDAIHKVILLLQFCTN